MSSERDLVSPATPLEYFREVLVEAKKSQGVEVADVTEYYLVNLLSQFLTVEKLYVREDDGALRQEPLALILQKALEGDRAEKVRELKRLGDTSLYVAGFLPDSLEQRVVDVDYYMEMGRTAYGSLRNLLEVGRGRELGFASLYGELADRFRDIVDLLNEVSERFALTNSQGVLRLYDRFRRTGSTRIARLLAEQGMAPALASRTKGLA